MPREGIDYPGWWNRAACSIRCELSKLWSAVGSKVAKINTVEPDGDGKVNVVSDTAALIVTDDQGSNAVRLSLDPAVVTPPVTSVNGETGAVVLDNTEIKGSALYYDGSATILSIQTVKNALNRTAQGAKAGDDALRTRMTAAESAITTETSTRIAEDALLQSALNGKADTGDSYTKQESDARYADVATPHTWAEEQTFDDGIDVNGDADVSGDLDVTGAAKVSSLTADQAKPSTLFHQSSGSTVTNKWRVIGKVSLASGENMRCRFYMPTTQSSRVTMGQIYISYTTAEIRAYYTAYMTPEYLAVNYDGAGNAIILVKTHYSYQVSRFLPIYVEKSDYPSGTVIDYSDTTEYASPSDFPYANTIYGTYTLMNLDVNTPAPGESDTNRAVNMAWCADTTGLNNLAHKDGNETFTGTKLFAVNPQNVVDYTLNRNTEGWYKVYEWSGSIVNIITKLYACEGDAYFIEIGWRTSSTPKAYFLCSRGDASVVMRVTKDSNGVFTLWCNFKSYHASHVLGYDANGNLAYPTIPSDAGTVYSEPTTSDYVVVVTPTYQA